MEELDAETTQSDEGGWGDDVDSAAAEPLAETQDDEAGWGDDED